MPITWGVFRPSILLPAVVARSLETDTGSRFHSGDDDSDRLEAVLAHECAHVARWDALAQLVAEVAVAMWWFNPLVWAAARQARLERERACDDAVLARGMRASDYARHLVAIVRALQPAPAVTVNTLAMARRSRLEVRVESILNARINRSTGSRASALVAAALVVFMLPMSAGRLTARAAEATSGPGAVARDILLPTTERASTDTADVRLVSTVPKRSPRAQPAQPPPAPPQDAEDRWRAERAEMFRQLIERAQRHVDNAKARVQIGTLAAFEPSVAELALVQVQLAHVDTRSRLSPTEAEMVAIRQRFALAMRNLDQVETRYNVGLADQHALADALKAAMATLGRSVTITIEAGPSLSDAELIAALRNATSITPDRARADALLALSARYALSPEMVALYVAAANSISSESERARVFAQSIRLKGSV